MFRKVSYSSISAGVHRDMIVGHPSETITTSVKEECDLNMKRAPDLAHAAAKIQEGLSIVLRETGNSLPVRISLMYTEQHSLAGGLEVHAAAREYAVTHPGSPHTPSVFVSDLADPSALVQVDPSLNTLESDPSVISLNSFSFKLPSGVGVPFKLTVL